MNEIRTNKKTIVLYTDEKEIMDKLRKHKRSSLLKPVYHWLGEVRILVGWEYHFDIKEKKWLRKITN